MSSRQSSPIHLFCCSGRCSKCSLCSHPKHSSRPRRSFIQQPISPSSSINGKKVFSVKICIAGQFSIPQTHARARNQVTASPLPPDVNCFLPPCSMDGSSSSKYQHHRNVIAFLGMGGNCLLKFQIPELGNQWNQCRFPIHQIHDIHPNYAVPLHLSLPRTPPPPYLLLPHIVSMVVV